MECEEFKELALDMTWDVCDACQTRAPTVMERPCYTAYADPKLNVKPTLCAECAEQDQSYWKSLWDDYNSSRL